MYKEKYIYIYKINEYLIQACHDTHALHIFRTNRCFLLLTAEQTIKQNQKNSTIEF